MPEPPSVPELSLVILCYRAEEFAQVFVSQIRETLERKGLRYELVLVANYDAQTKRPDRTPQIVCELARQDPRIRVVTRPKQGMMGWDMRSGMEVATGETIAVIDGDGQMPAEDVIAVYEALRRCPYDMVQTYRVKRFDGLSRRIVSRVYNLLFKLLFPAVPVRDANAKPKILTRQALQQLSLTSNGWFIDAEILIRASAKGLRIGEVPTVFYRNPHRRSFIGLRAILEFVRELARYRILLMRRDGRR